MTLSASGNPHHWQAEVYPDHAPVRQGLSTWRVLVLFLGLPLTTAATLGAWALSSPATLVQVRIVADLAGPIGRAALAEAALRIDAGPDRPATLEDTGDALVIGVADADAAVARRRARSTAETVLNLPLASPPGPFATARASQQPRPGGRAALLADRSRLQTAIDAVDARAAAVSASLTGIMRDIAAGLRVSAERKGSHETLDKGAAALAGLQLQRIQLQSRYQDDFPAVVALDGQIHTLRVFLQDETRRVDGVRAPNDPADPVLGVERDRLRAELVQLGDRRVTLAAELAADNHGLAAAPPEEMARPAQAPAELPRPMLIEAATTMSSVPDKSWIATPAVAAAGLLLVVGAWFKPRRHPRALPSDLLLEQIHALMLPQGSVGADSYPALARHEAALMLGSRRTPATVQGRGYPAQRS